MSMLKIQEYIIQELQTNRMADFKKGQTLVKRDESSKNKWVKFLVERGYDVASAVLIFKDAQDVAILELRAE